MNQGNWEYNAELQAVNDIMASIGESPVQTLEGDTNVDVVNARRLLHSVNRQVQSRGWSFNIDENVELVPDVFSGLISYLPDYLSMLSPSGKSTYTNRGGYVFDRVGRTDVFSGSIIVTLISLRPFEEMPPVFQTWIVNRAARMFNSRFFGAAEINADLTALEDESLRLVNEYEIDYAAENVFSSDPFVSQAVGR